MVKGISAINSIAKKGMFALMLAGTVSLGASSPIKNTIQEKEPQQTELMSKESAEALKLNSLQQTPTVPTVHNPKLDKTLKKFAESQEEINDFTELQNNVYSDYGIYLGSALIQKEIDKHMLWAFLYKKTDLLVNNNINRELGKNIQGFGEPFYATITPNADVIKQWLYKYNNTINSNLQFDHKPTAQEVSDRLDYIAENKCNFTKEEITKYKVYCSDFLYNHIKGKKDLQAQSDMLAYKMFMIDFLNFSKSLYGAGVFGMGSFDDNNGHDMRYFYQEWMESVAPKAD